MMEHFLSTLEKTIKGNWDKVGLSNYHGEDFTYGQFATQVEKFHIFYDQAGLEKRDKVALCASNSARWAITFLSTVSADRIIVPLLSEFHPDNVNTLVDHSESLVLVVDKDIWEKLDIAKMPRLIAVICANDFSLLWSRDQNIADIYNNLDNTFAQKYPQGYSAADVCFPVDNEKEIAVINYTSGTTSQPKGVMLRYESLSSMVVFGAQELPCSNNDSIVSMLPMGHIYGLAFEFLYPYCNGVHVFYLGKSPAASTLLKAVGEIKPYIVVAVPLIMEKVYKNKIKPILDKPALKVLTAIPGISNIIYSVVRKKLMTAFGGNVNQFIMGGAALNPEVEKVFKKIRLPFTVGYGMTEASPLLAYTNPKYFVPTSCGHVFKFSEVRIDSADPENIPGEIQARGINICSGYYKNPEASANAFTEDGWLRTGDLGVMKNGIIFIKGRSKNMILTANGQNVYPEELEAVVNNQPYVVETVVVCRGSNLVALVYPDYDTIKKESVDLNALGEQIRIASNKVLPSYSKIAKVEFQEKPFEKTPKMSIRRFLYS